MNNWIIRLGDQIRPAKTQVLAVQDLRSNWIQNQQLFQSMTLPSYWPILMTNQKRVNCNMSLPLIATFLHPWISLDLSWRKPIEPGRRQWRTNGRRARLFIWNPFATGSVSTLTLIWQHLWYTTPQSSGNLFSIV